MEAVSAGRTRSHGDALDLTALRVVQNGAGAQGVVAFAEHGGRDPDVLAGDGGGGETATLHHGADIGDGDAPVDEVCGREFRRIAGVRFTSQFCGAVLFRGSAVHHVLLFQEVNRTLFVRPFFGSFLRVTRTLERRRYVRYSRCGDRRVQAAAYVRLG